MPTCVLPNASDSAAAVGSLAQARARREDDASLGGVLRHPGVWRGGSSREAAGALPSGIADLDAHLPGGGWPRGALTEILCEHDGLGELGLLVPAFASLTRARERIALIAPPYLPFAPAWAAGGVDPACLVRIDARVAEHGWAGEQCLRAGCIAAVMMWLPSADYRQLRRLQLAAETGGSLGFAFRPASALSKPSPAALRLRVCADARTTRLDIVKCRGRFGSAGAALPLRA